MLLVYNHISKTPHYLKFSLRLFHCRVLKDFFTMNFHLVLVTKIIKGCGQ